MTEFEESIRQRLTANANDFDGIVTELLTELEALQVDAKRYRWLRDHSATFEYLRNKALPHITLDREVDRERKKQAIEIDPYLQTR